MTVDLVHQHVGAPVGVARRRGRRLDTYSVEIGGGLCANVVGGALVGFGLEPVGPLVAVHAIERRRLLLVWAAPAFATAAAGVAAVATGVVLRHRRAA